MTSAKRSILQVNTTDIGGGAAAVAFSLHQSYRARGHRSRMAVGTKRSNDPDIFEIPNLESRSGWARAFLALSETVTPIVGKVRGADRARGLIREIGSPVSAIQRRLGHEDFDFPGTWKIVSGVGKGSEVLHLHNLHGGYFDLRALPSLSAVVPTVVTMHDEWMYTGHCAYTFGCDRWETGCVHCPDLAVLPAIPRDATAHNWNRKKSIYKQSNLVIVTPSRWLADRARRSILTEGSARTLVIHNGVDQQIFKPGEKQAARQRLGIPGDEAVIMFAANGIRENMFKDYPSLQKAITSLSATLRDRRFVFLGVGDSGPDESVENGSVRFIPHVRDRNTLADYYRAADLYMHAARAENFPNTVIEALSCGTPVVATAVGGIPEQIRSLAIPESDDLAGGTVDGEANGILTPAGDGERLGRAAAWLLQRPEILAALSRNAASDAAKRFSLERQADEYLDLYESMIAARASSPHMAVSQ